MNRIATRLSVVILPLIVLFGPTSYAGKITVTNLKDSGDGSLRGAIQKANKADTKDGPALIIFKAGLSGTINLTTGPLQITNDVEIDGPGATTITVNSSASNSTVFIISFGNVAISGLTISGGNNPAGGAWVRAGRAAGGLRSSPRDCEQSGSIHPP